MLDLIGEHLQTTRWAKLHYDRNKMGDLLTGNVKNITFFCDIALNDKGEVIGGLCASVNAYIFSHDAIASDHLFYVPPETNEGPEIATALVESYVNWGQERKVKELQLRNATGNNVEAYALFMQKLGFKRVGTLHAKEM